MDAATRRRVRQRAENRSPASPPRGAEGISPAPCHTVGVQLGVVAHERETFSQGLSDQKPVEWVSMVKWQPDHPRGMRGQDGEQVEAVRVQGKVDEILIGPVELPLAQADLDGDLPVGRRADEHFIRRVLDNRLRRRTELGIAFDVMTVALDAMLASTPDVCGGRIRIDGTRITVHRVATLYKQGQSAEDIAQTYPHLSLGQIYAALAYYHTNRAEIDSELAAADALYDELKRDDIAQGDAP